MRAILLAGGLGTRLRPLTDEVPKCLAPIGGRPLLAYWLDALFGAGVERVLVNLHHLPHRVEAFLATHPERERIEPVFEPTLLGTAGTIAVNAGFFGGEAGLVIHADNLSDLDPVALMAAHRRRPARCAMTMAAFETDAPQSCGILELDADGVVAAFHEKVGRPPGNLANAAVYVLEPEVTAACGARFGEFLDFSTAIIPLYMGRIAVYRHAGYHRDIGSPESLARAQRDLATRGQALP